MSLSSTIPAPARLDRAQALHAGGQPDPRLGNADAARALVLPSRSVKSASSTVRALKPEVAILAMFWAITLAIGERNRPTADAGKDRGMSMDQNRTWKAWSYQRASAA